jgi:hypothetical protein
LGILEDKLSKDEVDLFNSLLIKNEVKTISSDNISNWIRYWFKIFNRKSDIFLNNSERILKEIEEDCKKFESYATSIPNDSSKVIDYTPYLKKFDDFKND